MGRPKAVIIWRTSGVAAKAFTMFPIAVSTSVSLVPRAQTNCWAEVPAGKVVLIRRNSANLVAIRAASVSGSPTAVVIVAWSVAVKVVIAVGTLVEL